MRNWHSLSLGIVLAAMCSSASAGVYISHHESDARAAVIAEKVQFFAKKRGGRIVRRPAARPRPKAVQRPRIRRPAVQARRRNRPPASSPAYARPPVIDSVEAVRIARSRANGEVLNVRRAGSVYKVKIDGGNRLFIVNIDAVTGRVTGVE